MIAQQRLGGRDPISILSGMLRLSYVENPGAFLGLGAGLSEQARFWLFVVAVASGLVLLAALAVAVRTTDAAQLTAVAMMIGGGAEEIMKELAARQLAL